MERESVPQVNFADNKELKYLKEHLAPIKDPSVKAAIYITYLENCDFNTTMAPNSIIQFDNDDVTEILSVDNNPDTTMQVKTFHNLITFVSSCQDIGSLFCKLLLNLMEPGHIIQNPIKLTMDKSEI